LQSNAKKFTRGTGRLGRSLIIAQMALSLVVLAVAGLFIRTLTHLRGIELGYEPHGVLDASLYPTPGGYKKLDWVNYYQELTARVARLPGVESAGIAKMSLGWRAWKEDVRSGQNTAGLPKIDIALVMPGFFKTVRIDLQEGRSFTWQDDGSAPRVAIVSRSLARRLFGDSDPIARHIEVTSEPKWQKVEIVGVVSDASLYDIRQHAPPALYLPLTQYGEMMGWSQLMLRTQAAPTSSAVVVRQTVESLGHEYVAKTHLIEETIDRSILRERLFAILSGFFGALALLLAAVGLYGLMAYNVSQRTREIGVRMALGATRRDVVSMILHETLGMTGIGLLLGIAAALSSLHFVSNLVYGVSARDPITLAAACVILAFVAALAGWLPAWKAMKVDPMVALRHD
jgi:predicted permease